MARRYRKRYVNNDPRVIRARYDSVCAETGKVIKEGEECVYYPLSREVFHVDSVQASEFRAWQFDIHCLGGSY